MFRQKIKQLEEELVKAKQLSKWQTSQQLAAKEMKESIKNALTELYKRD